MKHLVLKALLVSLFFSCDTIPVQTPIDKRQYTIELLNIWEHHGGLLKWQKMKSLSFELIKEAGNETHKIDLQSRYERIESPDFKTGYDGEQFWLEADTSYSGNPIFYHNLMFYFYAMPFVLADDGIVYGDTEPLVYDNVSYPGIRISYEEGVGVSSKDEYFIHYHPDTYEMAWLGYTVTYFSGEKADKISWIRYDDWQIVSGLRLPQSMEWYKVEDGIITEPRNRRSFTNVSLSENVFPQNTFSMPPSAKRIELAD